ncbi:hypothetical protein [Frondihabitans australicus]|uniref:hypothetical protein n=1 Tax=Frondihabitans australicus TaxID=386892 RepID=UPI0011C4734B|nr:hypothetical protein [Frondihabitans australicus]
MGKRIRLRDFLPGGGRKSRGSREHGTHESVQRSVDTALIIEAARHVVATRVATQASLGRHLYVAPAVADHLLTRLEHCKVIAPARNGQPHRVIATSAELPGLIEEFQRRSVITQQPGEASSRG